MNYINCLLFYHLANVSRISTINDKPQFQFMVDFLFFQSFSNRRYRACRKPVPKARRRSRNMNKIVARRK